MDALLLINPDHLADAQTPLAQILGRARFAQGVIAFVTAPLDADANGEAAASCAERRVGNGSAADWAAGLVEDLYGDAGPTMAVAPAEDDLVLESQLADAFDGVDELAQGLHEMNVDRIIIGGADLRGALHETALAALACNFDLVVLADASVDDAGGQVEWLDEAAEVGAVVRPAAETWLRM